MQFINKTAYIQIAIRGKNFCMAAYDGFNLVWSNAMRYAIVSGVGEIIMFLGKILISVITALAFYCLITYVKSIAQTIFEPILLVVVTFLLTLDRINHLLRRRNTIYGCVQYCHGYFIGLFHN